MFNGKLNHHRKILRQLKTRYNAPPFNELIVAEPVLSGEGEETEWLDSSFAEFKDYKLTVTKDKKGKKTLIDPTKELRNAQLKELVKRYANIRLALQAKVALEKNVL